MRNILIFGTASPGIVILASFDSPEAPSIRARLEA